MQNESRTGERSEAANRTLTTSNRAGNDSGRGRCNACGRSFLDCGSAAQCERNQAEQAARVVLPCLAEQLADASIWLKHFRGERARVLSDYAYAWLYRAGSRLDERTERALGEPEPVPAAPRYQAPTIEAEILEPADLATVPDLADILREPARATVDNCGPAFYQGTPFEQCDARDQDTGARCALLVNHDGEHLTRPARRKDDEPGADELAARLVRATDTDPALGQTLRAWAADTVRAFRAGAAMPAWPIDGRD